MAVRSVPREYGPKVGETIPSFSALNQFGRRQTLETIAGPAGGGDRLHAQRGLVTILQRPARGVGETR